MDTKTHNTNSFNLFFYSLLFILYARISSTISPLYFKIGGYFVISLWAYLYCGRLGISLRGIFGSSQIPFLSLIGYSLLERVFSFTLVTGTLSLLSFSFPLGIWRYFNTPDISGDTISFIFILLVAAPLLEEFSFRGILLNRVTDISIKERVILVCVVFSLLHGSHAPLMFLGSYLLAYVYLKTRSLYATIFMHFMYNLPVAVLSLLVFYHGEAVSIVEIRKISLISSFVFLAVLS